MLPDTSPSGMTPREIVSELDKHIIGQHEAKRAVAIALRNRWRRMQLDESLRGKTREQLADRALGQAEPLAGFGDTPFGTFEGIERKQGTKTIDDLPHAASMRMPPGCRNPVVRPIRTLPEDHALSTGPRRLAPCSSSGHAAATCSAGPLTPSSM